MEDMEDISFEQYVDRGINMKDLRKIAKNLDRTGFHCAYVYFRGIRKCAV